MPISLSCSRTAPIPIDGTRTMSVAGTARSRAQLLKQCGTKPSAKARNLWRRCRTRTTAWANFSRRPATLPQVHGSFVRFLDLSCSLADSIIENLADWGYVLSGVEYGYRNFATGGYWGVADLLQHTGVSSKCQEEGGQWSAAVITYCIAESAQPIEQQTFVMALV